MINGVLWWFDVSVDGVVRISDVIVRVSGVLVSILCILNF